MGEIRYFNPTGREMWSQWLDSLAADPKLQIPENLLSNPEWTRKVPGDLKIEVKNYASKYEMAKALSCVVVSIENEGFTSDRWPGLWDWLAASFWDSICPADSSGNRKLLERARYVFSARWDRQYRHRVAGPVQLFRRVGEFSDLLLNGEPATLTDWEEQAVSRYLITSNPRIAKAMRVLYWDEVKQKPKRGAAPNDHLSGTLRRFTDLMQQLSRTYDLHVIDTNGILSLLPRKEFKKFLPS